MNFEVMRRGCPNFIIINTGQTKGCCKALLGQPNDVECKPENCAALYIADLMLNELRAEIGGKNHENHGGAAASSEEDQS
jgi:hypothetical protein